MLQTSPRISSTVYKLLKEAEGTAKGARKIHASRASGSLFTVTRMKTNTCKHPHSKSVTCTAMLCTNAAVLLLEGVVLGNTAAERSNAASSSGVGNANSGEKIRCCCSSNQARGMIKTS